MSSSSTSSTLFTGSSRYSQDFQNVITRSVAIASLPMTQMQRELQVLKDDSTVLSSIDSKFSALQSAVTAIQTSLGAPSYSGTVSDTEIASVGIADGAREGTYKVKITDYGSYAVATSKTDGSLIRVTDPTTGNLTGSPDFTLQVGTGTAISLHATSLNQLVDAINAKAGSQVSASAVNIGNADGNPQYVLNIQSTTLQPLAISFKNSAGETIVDQPVSAGGATVKYQVNDAAVASSTSRVVQLATGVAVNFLENNNTAITVSVTRNSSSLQTALQSFATAYNNVVGELDKYHGSGSAGLSDAGILLSLSDALRGVPQYSAGSGSLTSLRDIGLELDSSGRLSLNTQTFYTATKNGLSSVSTFLGTTTSNGFLKSISDQVSAVENIDKGILKSAIATNDAAVETANDRISEEQNRIDALQTSLQAQMAAADALIASLEQQASYVSSMFQAMQQASDTYK